MHLYTWFLQLKDPVKIAFGTLALGILVAIGSVIRYFLDKQNNNQPIRYKSPDIKQKDNGKSTINY